MRVRVGEECVQIKLVSDTTSVLYPSAYNHARTHTQLRVLVTSLLTLMHSNRDFPSDLLLTLVYKGAETNSRHIKQCNCRYFVSPFPSSYLSCPAAKRQGDKCTLSCRSNAASNSNCSEVGVMRFLKKDGQRVKARRGLVPKTKTFDIF